MNLLAQVLDYFASDPMRLLALVGGSGGLVYWMDRFRDRSRLTAALVSITSHRCTVEVENVGRHMTSLLSEIRCSGYTINWRKVEGRLKIRDPDGYQVDRSLPPMTPKRFYAEPVYPLSHLDSMSHTTLRLRATRGRGTKVRITHLITTTSRVHFWTTFLLRMLWAHTGIRPGPRTLRFVLQSSGDDESVVSTYDRPVRYICSKCNSGYLAPPMTYMITPTMGHPGQILLECPRGHREWYGRPDLQIGDDE